MFQIIVASQSQTVTISHACDYNSSHTGTTNSIFTKET